MEYITVLLVRKACTECKDFAYVTDVAWSVSACLAARVILSRETPSRRATKCAKTAEPIEMLWTRASLRNHALGGPASQREGAIMGDTLRPNAH